MDNAIYIDVETTGLDPSRDRIIQMAVLKDSGLELNLYFNPGFSISETVTKINGITNERVANEGKFEDIAQAIWYELKASKIFVAYNFQFDFSFIQAELARCGLSLKSEDFIFIDPMALFKRQVPHSLAMAYKYYIGNSLEGAHDAMVDIKATRQILDKQLDWDLEVFSLRQNQDWKGIQKLTIGDVGIIGKWFDKLENGDIVFKQGKHKGLKAEDCTSYLSWVSGLPDITYDEKLYIEGILNG